MKLIHRTSGAIVQIGDRVKTFRGEAATVTGWREPHKPASSGYVSIAIDGLTGSAEYHVGVANLEWIDREDRD